MFYMCIFFHLDVPRGGCVCLDVYIEIKSSAFQGGHLNLRSEGRVRARRFSCRSPSVHLVSLSNQPPPSSASYLSLNREVILSPGITLPCFHLSRLSSHGSSSSLPFVSPVPPFSPQPHTWPNHSTDTKFRSLYPPLSALALQLVCVTECSASAYSH